MADCKTSTWQLSEAPFGHMTSRLHTTADEPKLTEANEKWKKCGIKNGCDFETYGAEHTNTPSISLNSDLFCKYRKKHLYSELMNCSTTETVNSVLLDKCFNAPSVHPVEQSSAITQELKKKRRQFVKNLKAKAVSSLNAKTEQTKWESNILHQSIDNCSPTYCKKIKKVQTSNGYDVPVKNRFNKSDNYFLAPLNNILENVNQTGSYLQTFDENSADSGVSHVITTSSTRPSSVSLSKTTKDETAKLFVPVEHLPSTLNVDSSQIKCQAARFEKNCSPNANVYPSSVAPLPTVPTIFRPVPKEKPEIFCEYQRHTNDSRPNDITVPLHSVSLPIEYISNGQILVPSPVCNLGNKDAPSMSCVRQINHPSAELGGTDETKTKRKYPAVPRHVYNYAQFAELCRAREDEMAVHFLVTKYLSDN